MWRYLNVHTNLNDESLFLSLETRHAILLRKPALSLINAELTAIAQIDRSMLLDSSKIADMALFDEDAFEYLRRTFAANSVFQHSGELLYLTYTSSGTSGLTSAISNDLKFFSLLHARFAEFSVITFSNVKIQTDFTFLATTNAYLVRAFGYQRNYFRYFIPQNLMFLLQIHCILQTQEVGGTYKLTIQDAGKWQNISGLRCAPGAFSEYLYYEVH